MEFQGFFSSEKWFGTEFRGFFSSEKWFGTEFQSFSLTRNRRNSDGTAVCSVCSVWFRITRNNFLSENGNPSWGSLTRYRRPAVWQLRLQQPSRPTAVAPGCIKYFNSCLEKSGKLGSLREGQEPGLIEAMEYLSRHGAR
jgi:hypothetical protein